MYLHQADSFVTNAVYINKFNFNFFIVVELFLMYYALY